MTPQLSSDNEERIWQRAHLRQPQQHRHAHPGHDAHAGARRPGRRAARLLARC